MNTRSGIVVGFDGSPNSLAATTWAAEVADHRGEPLVVTTIVDPRETPRGTAWPASWWDEQEALARSVLARWPDVLVTFARHGGHLVPMLVKAAEDATMLVVGSLGHSPVGDILLGSVSQGCARHSTRPVVVVRPADNPGAGRIVVGVDGSPSGDRALDFACEMAAMTGDKIVVLRAWHPRPHPADRYGHRAPLAEEETVDHAGDALGRVVDRIRGQRGDLDVEGELYQGAPERGLVEASANAAMVVVGSRGRSAAAEVLMGSVSNAVLHKAHCPVAVVR